MAPQNREKHNESPEPRQQEESNFGSPHDQDHPRDHGQTKRRAEGEMKQSETRGSGRQRWSGDPEEYGYRPEPRFQKQYRESFRGESSEFGQRFQESSRSESYNSTRAGDERQEYEEWLQEHDHEDRGTEGERQLEGLREEHRSHRSDHRHDAEHYPRTRSQRQFAESKSAKEVVRPTENRSALKTKRSGVKRERS